MYYTDWQIDRVRRALARYKEFGGPDGTALKLTKVYERILQSPVAETESRSGHLTFKYEVLRRFINDGTTPELHNFENIIRFLIAEQWLDKSSLDPDKTGQAEMIAVTRFFARSDAAAIDAVQTLEANYQAQKEVDGFEFVLRLETLPNADGFTFEAQETFSVTEVNGADNSTSFDRREKFQKTGTRRKGYGFLATENNLLYVILRGADASDRIFYCQAFYRPALALRGLFVLRSGEFMATKLESKLDPNAPLTLDYGFKLVSVDKEVRTSNV